MDFLNNIKTSLQQIKWDINSISVLITSIIVIVTTVLLFIKNSAVRKFYDSVIHEMKVVEWLKPKQILRYTLLVIAISIIGIAIMSPLDALFIFLKNKFIFV